MTKALTLHTSAARQGQQAWQRPTPADLARIDIAGHVSYHRSFQRVLRMEEALVLALFADFGTGQPGFRNVIGFHDPGDRPFPWYTEKVILPLYRVFVLDDNLATLRRRINQQHTLAIKPYHEARGGWDELERTENDPRITIQDLAPAAIGYVKAAARADAQRGLARFALAASRYRAAQARLPEKVDDLLPEYLPAVPSDPFDGKPLKWKRTDAGGLVLYSIGPDMTDDGGKPIDNAGQTGDFTFELAPWTPGTSE